MLKQRVLTAAILLIVLAGALVSGERWIFLSLSLIFLAIGIWEWMRLVGAGHATAVAVAAVMALVLAAAHRLGWVAEALPAILLIAVSLWLILALVLVALHRFPQVAPYRGFYLAAGLVLPGAAWLAMAQTFEHGAWFMISVLAVIWVADIGAYFCGRAFGRHKLAPSISPGKTWEGVIGAIVTVWVVAALVALVPQLAGAFTSQLFARFPSLLVLIMLALLVGISVVGDLFESHLKRQAGVKDSSGLLPGHGGVLDRIDSLLPVLPIAFLIYRLAVGAVA
jgi:phosphatidate cytidylyltransferase